MSASASPKSKRRLAAPLTPKLVEAVRRGLPFADMESLRKALQLPLESLGVHLGIARATLHRRKAAGLLSPAESDKVLRFRRLLAQATETLGGVNEARAWLAAPQTGLGGSIPLTYAGTEVGAREVESLLGRIEHGVYT